jgi:hypothetical protein
MPPFNVINSASTPQSPPSPSNGNSFASLLKNLTSRGGSKAQSTISSSGASVSSVGSSELEHHTKDPKVAPRPSLIGGSSRGAGVRPSRNAAVTSANTLSGYPRREDSAMEEFEAMMSTGAVREGSGGSALAGPSRGGFMVHSSHASKTAPAIVTSAQISQASTTASTSKLEALMSTSTLAPSPSRRRSLEVPAVVVREDESDSQPTLPPSQIILRLAALVQTSMDTATLVPLIRLLSKSVSLYPFPPPSLASATALSQALASQPNSPASEYPAVNPITAPKPSPLQIYLSQSHLLVPSATTEVRAAVLELLRSCVDASLGSTGGIKEGEKAVYWEEARRWADEGKIEVEEGDERKAVLPPADREGLVAILSSLTRAGRDLSDVPGLVALLCAFVTDSLPFPAPPSPLFDATLATPFIRTTPYVPAAHTTSLALLTAIHKFSAPHIYTASTLLAIRAVLEVAKQQEERDIGGQSDVGVLAFLGAVVRFGEVTGGKAARRRRQRVYGQIDTPDPENSSFGENEGDEILRQVVSVVARMIACEGLVGVVGVTAGRPLPKVHDQRILPSVLPPLALELMRDLLRSPANQALKSLRATLVAPPSTTPTPPTPVLLLVGSLRSLRKALLEHSADIEASASRKESASLTTGETRWPSLLSLGLPYLWNGLVRVMEWKSGHVDGEVLRLVEERLVAFERVAAREKEAAAAPGGTGTVDDTEGGVPFEVWDMAIESLEKTRWHIATWEELRKRPWIMSDGQSLSVRSSTSTDPYPTPESSGYESGSGLRLAAPKSLLTQSSSIDSSSDEDAPTHFTRRPDVLAAFTLLLKRVLRAWCSPGFSGPSERLFALLLVLAPHLAESYSLSILTQCELKGMCLPSHPEWLTRVEEVIQAFYVVQGDGAPRTRRVLSSTTRHRVIQLLSGLYTYVRDFDTLRNALVASVIMPLLETKFDAEVDGEVAEVLLELMITMSRDALLVEEDEEGDGRLDMFDRLRLLLVRVAKGASRPVDRYSGTTTGSNRAKRGTTLSSISRYHKDSSPSTMRSPPSISTPLSNSMQHLPSVQANDVSFLVVMALTTLFHICLSRATRRASEKAIIVFRDILTLLVPSLRAPLEVPDVSVQTRFAILQWLVRLRADAAHRIHWIKDVDISVQAKFLGRLDVVPEVATDALTVVMGNGGGEEEGRGRTGRGQAADRTGRNISGSRLRLQSEERSPNRAGSGSRSRALPPAASPTPTLWTIPESLPFDFGDEVNPIGGTTTALASFDHNQMRNWTEEEDPGTGLMKVTEAQDPAPPTELSIVLPISEYLTAINYLLKNETEWELVAYILCHLPEQLSNKHFACGPRAAQQIHILRRQLCDGLRGGDRVFLADILLPPTLKRAEVHAAAYQCLTSLIAYRSLFNKSQQDDMVDTFMFGLGNPRDTAKPCIHALAMSVFELRPSVTKHLAEIVRHLQKIISSSTLGVHILEFIAGVGQEPSLYANFTEIDFQTVFGIALKYIQAHNDRLADNPQALAQEEGLEYAFSQYVFLLAYYVIAAWYMALRLSERRKYVPFLTRRLVQANEGKPEIDEPTEVCFDMIARYAYSNADPRPRHSTFDKIITSGRNPSDLPSKTWIIGHSTVTVKSTHAPAWVEVTIRRASGVVRMLWELQNMSGVAASSDGDLIAMYLRHRESAQTSKGIASVVSEALSILPAIPRQPFLGHRARSHSFSGSSTAALPTIEDNIVSDAINSAATVAAQPTLESGLLAVDPSFFTLQLSSFPHIGANDAPLLVPNDAPSQRGLASLDRMPVVDFHKIGVLYAGPGQRTENEILRNTHGSKPYIEFISSLGKLIRLKGSRDLDIYAGGLDQDTDIDGKWTYLWDDDISQMVFHIATLMPTSPETDPLATLKKRHIGNDFVKIIFNDSGEDYAFDTLPGDFNFVNIIIQPHTPAGNPWIGPGMTNNAEFFKVSMQCRPGMPEVGPLGSFKMVTGSSLPSFVRQLSLHSNIWGQIYLASVGFEARQGAQKIEYSSNWRRRYVRFRRASERLC